MDNLFALIWLAPLLPLLAAGAIALRMVRGRASGDAGEPPTARIATLAALASMLLLLACDLAALLHGAPGAVRVGTWFASGELSIPLSFTLDGLSLGFATLAAAIAFLTLRFSVNYLHREAGFHRFFMAMCVFTAGMLLIVLSGNAVLAFAGWELAGVSSWMLIGYAYERPTASSNAQRAFVTNRVGDAGFILAIALAAAWLGNMEWTSITALRLETLAAGLLALGFVVAALAKSAQLPFVPWIARALEGPTPSSAIFYGALMVHAGVYLLLRLEGLLLQAPLVMTVIAVLGLFTALYGWLSGLVQTDVKSTLIFSVTTQVGLMFFAIGLGWFTLAAWYMGLHAVWRAYQFLASPSYMHLVGGPAPAVPAWLAQRQGLFTAALQRFWIELVSDWLLVRPTLGLARDVRDLDDRVVSRLVGLPEEARAVGEDERVVFGRGLAGSLLEWVAERLYGFERRLVLQEGGGQLSRLIRQIGEALLAVERLLERPRYLALLIMATFVVIL